MAETAVTPEDIASLTRRLAESEAAARVIRTKLEAVGGPLAVLAALRVQHIEDAIVSLLAVAHDAAEVALSVPSSVPPE